MKKTISFYLFLFSCTLFCVLSCKVGSSQILYGLTAAGGDSSGGVLYQYNAFTSQENVIYPFAPQAPFGPTSNLIQATDGNYYGITSYGGRTGYGVIFKITSSGHFTTIANFNNHNNSYPCLMIQATDGNFYGVTAGGGTYNYGTIFKCTLSGVLTTLINFNDTNGAYPYGNIMQASDGNLYGTTSYGGSSKNGTLFKCTTSGILSVLINFNKTDGDGPAGALLQAKDSNLYGTTEGGGKFNDGTIFKCTTSGSLTTLVNFNDTNGYEPRAGLIQAFDGNFYGTTVSGGDSGLGTLFKCTPAGAITTLVSFHDTIGKNPYGSLLQAKDSNLFGMTESGGFPSGYYYNGNFGTVFKCTTSGSLITMLKFDSIHGKNPENSLIQSTDGNLYGLAPSGGSVNGGTFFKITTTDTLTTLFNFGDVLIGTPTGNLILASDNNIYGMTNAFKGEIFKYTLSDTVKNLTNTGIDNGAIGFLQATDGNFYGITSGGGNDFGTIFKCSISGVANPISSFSLYGAFNPSGNLMQASDGNLYGTTIAYNKAPLGTLFKCTTSGLFTILAHFTGDAPYGFYPDGSLIQTSDGNLYGMTMEGGATSGKYPGGNGIIFKYDIDSNIIRTLVNFNDTNGGVPCGGLIQASDGCIYGMTSRGGTKDSGIIFKYTLAGTLTTLVNFNGTNGAGPRGSLIQASDGNLYGTTPTGGSYGFGTLFKCTTSGVLTTLLNFNSSNGAKPFGNLLEVTQGPLTVNKITDEGIVNIYPNPGKGLFTVSLGTLNENTKIEIYSVLGEKIFEKIFRQVNGLELNLSALPNGIYFARIITNHTITKKIVLDK
jgi:uncharacterized repeat protein (TIGR03803 family)